ncbi:NmrA family protein [Cellulomonas flavigena DSM 20109]|uniref:NmrA family protein n=1 Tax=Cellulomonas flavigena (strain ATCC 482 / DSM 20109 / BCRC 11376 / JCM 18109 / NBRC 3775 / NCIMB 8073 / NRS 134) TaxID=446466 RepID=D5UC78_CELFN|nr:NAD-dependent epimerase/dehydratase family protein [Cellulomonas flavigena]ADG76237.1 NmrA family protein [Cellulomonas flavigena DSM 20109]
MRRVLVLGGTGWLGSAVARAALADGAQVVCLARGESGDVPDGARLVRADRTAPGAYDALTGDWDEVVEITSEPALVAGALDALADRAQHWTLVSTVSVYARHDVPGADESAELVEPRDLTAYPDAKVAAERATAARLGDRVLVARPGLIVGPGDPSDRFGYWPARLHRGGRVLVPAPEGRFVQVIDVDDLAAWLVAAGRAGVTGAVNAVGTPVTWADFLALVQDVTAVDVETVAVDDATLLAHDVRHWAGPRSLPLWIPVADAGFAQRDGSAYRAAGGTLRPLRETTARALADEVARGIDRPRRSGLTAAEERAVLGAVRAASRTGGAWR